MEFGDVDGYGRYGMLEYTDSGEHVMCHECGEEKRALGTHAWYVHGITAAEYRRRHGLSTGTGLAAPVTASRFGELGRSDQALAALAAYRDPARARRANTAEGRGRAERVEVRRATGRQSRRGRDMTAIEVAALDGAPDLLSWCGVAARLVDDGVRMAEIARRLNMPKVTVSERLRRWRAGSIAGQDQ